VGPDQTDPIEQEIVMSLAHDALDLTDEKVEPEAPALTAVSSAPGPMKTKLFPSNSIYDEVDISYSSDKDLDFGLLGPYLWQCDMCDSEPQPRLWESCKESTFCQECEIASIGAIKIFNVVRKIPGKLNYLRKNQ